MGDRNLIIANKLTGEILKSDVSVAEAAELLGMSTTQVYYQIRNRSFNDDWIYVRSEEDFRVGEEIRSHYPLLIADDEKSEIRLYPSLKSCTKNEGLNVSSVRTAIRRQQLLYGNYRLKPLRKVGLLSNAILQNIKICA